MSRRTIPRRPEILLEDLKVPVYEYRCTSCEHQFEVWQEVGAEPPACEECGAAVKKVFHPVRTIYKGSGFYITDTRSEKSGSASPKSTPAASSSESKTETKSTTADSSAPSTPAPAKSE